MSVSISNTTRDFLGLKAPRNLAIYARNKGISDFGNLAQFDLYEKGYSMLVVLKRPEYLVKLATEPSGNLSKNKLIPSWIAKNNKQIGALLDSFCDILEYEFRGLDGIPDITGETSAIEDGINSLNMLTKTTEDTAITVNMSFFEKSGSLLTKFIKFYIKGIKDTRTQARSYYGLVNPFVTDQSAATMEPGYENEVFSMLYMVTDNTYMRLEAAYLLLNCQFTTANTSMYETTKGDISFNEISIPMNCFPVSSVVVNEKATKMLQYLMTTDTADRYKLISDDFNYYGTSGESIYINGDAGHKADYIIERNGMVTNGNFDPNNINNAGGWRSPDKFGTGQGN